MFLDAKKRLHITIIHTDFKIITPKKTNPKTNRENYANY